MRILLLIDRVPDAPSDGLLLRVLALARELARRHTLDCVAWRMRGDAGPPEAGLFRRHWLLPGPPPRPRPRLGPLGGWHPDALYPRHPQFAALMAGAPGEAADAPSTAPPDPAHYDVVWDAGAVLFAQLPPRWSALPVVADLVDDMVLTFRRAAASATGLADRLRNWKYAHVFGRFECETMARVAHCVVVGEEDAASFARVSPGVPVSVVANGVDTVHFGPGDAPAEPGRIVFEGTMGFPPNAQAALHLVREIMPRVWAARPDARLTLVGREPPPAVQALAGERVTVTGAVPDVREHVRTAEVFACPLVSGAGIKNKLLQAWAMQRAVVATPLSVGGLAAVDGHELLLREDPADFAAAVVELLGDPARRAALGAAGRRAAVERFAWAAMAARFEALLAQAADSRGVTPPRR